MQILDSVATANAYTDAATISDVWNSSGGYAVVSVADAYVELQYVPHGPGSQEWTNEVHVPVNSPLTLLPGTTGVRFRSYLAGTPATVSAALAAEAEPPITLTTPGTVNVSGASTNYDHNGALVGLEPTLDFEDTGANVWTVTDDAVNKRVKVNGPRLLTGVVTAVGGVQAGTGFTVAKGSAGNYTVNFTVAFPAAPVVVCVSGPTGPAAVNCIQVVTLAAGSFSVFSFAPATGAGVDQVFSFLAYTTG